MDSIALNHACPYATLEELEYLRDVAPLCDCVVMIGAGPGVMALAVKEGNIGSLLTVIDIQSVQWTYAHLAQAHLNENVTFITRDSATVGREWEGPKVDLLIVDGDHSREGVTRDLQAWLPRLGARASIFLHDYDASGTMFAGQEQYPGVQLAVTDMPDGNSEYELLARVGTSIVYQRL